MNEVGIHSAFAELEGPVKEKTLRYSLLKTLDPRFFHPTIDAAVEALATAQLPQWPAGRGFIPTDAASLIK